MTWQPVAVADLPLVICGPMVRRVEAKAVTVWLALRESCAVTLRIFPATGPTTTPLFAGSGPSVQVGKHLHVVAVTARAPGTTKLDWGTVYRYDVVLDPVGPGTTRTLLAAGAVAKTASEAQAALTYPGFDLPSFALPPEDPAKLRLLHASCRKPHGGGIDALALVDRMIEKAPSDPLKRPQQLFLTGDQIYADDVADPLLAVLTATGDLLLDRAAPEKLPGVDKTGAELKPGKRQPVAEKHAGLTSTEAKSHLLTFAEFAAMYLLVWSPAAWPAALPPLADVHPDIASRVALEDELQKIPLGPDDGMPSPSAESKYAAHYELELAAVAGFQATVPAVRRALANIATYTIFDDHEITDDWYITLRWMRTVVDPEGKAKTSALGRRFIRNGLLAYAIFQGWGNTPAQYDGTTSPGGALLDAIGRWDGTEGNETKEIEKRIGLPTAFVQLKDPDRWVLKRPDGALDYHYQVTWARHQVIVLDTRTRRVFLGGEKDPPALVYEAEDLTAQIAAAPYIGREAVTVLISAAPIVGLPLLEDTIQPIVAFFEGAAAADKEAWAVQPDAFERLLGRLFTRAVPGDDGVRRQRIIALSGDVHYGFAAGLTYDAHKPYAPTTEPAEGVMAQLTSSSLKNEETKTKALHVIGFRRGLGGVPVKQRAGWANSGGKRFQAGTLPIPLLNSDDFRMPFYLSGSPAVTPIEDGFEPKGWPDWSYEIRFTRNREPDPEPAVRPGSPAPVAQPPADDRAAAIREYLAAAKNHDGYKGEWGNGKQLVGLNNLGEITFIWKDGDYKYVAQTLWWRLPGETEGAPLTKYVLDLSLNAHRPQLYGGFELRENDRDKQGTTPAKYAGRIQPATDPAATHVRQVKRDLRELGFALASPDDGAFTQRVRWAVRELQSYAKMARVAQQRTPTRLAAAVPAAATTVSVEATTGLPASGNHRLRVGPEMMLVTGGQGTTTLTVTRGIEGTTALDHAKGTAVTPLTGRYSEALDPVDNPSGLQYKGPVSGVVNAATQDIIRYWKEHAFRCPVVVEAYPAPSGNVQAGLYTIPAAGSVPARPAENMWLHDEVSPGVATRVFARDVSGYYTLPPGRPADHPSHPELIVLGRPVSYLSWSGPVARPDQRSTWRPEGEMLPEHLLPGTGLAGGPTLASLVQDASAQGRARLSTFKVVRSVAEVEALGFFDGLNAYDNAFISLGPCHWTAGPIDGSDVSPGELWGYLAYLRSVEPSAFEQAVGWCGIGPSQAWGTNGRALFQSGKRKYETRAEVEQHDAVPALLTPKVPEFDVFRMWHWFYRLQMAGRTIPGWRRRMWHMARLRIRDIREAPWDRPGQANPLPNVPNDEPSGPNPPPTRAPRIRDVITSERAMAMVYRWHILSPGSMVGGGAAGFRLRLALGRARQANPGAFGGSPDTWGQPAEDALIAALRAEAAAPPPATQANPNPVPDQNLINTLADVYGWPTWQQGSNEFSLPIALLPQQTQPAPPTAQARLFTGRGSFAFDASDLPQPRL